jgi:ATP-binding protein involved in chromosome partitioning
VKLLGQIPISESLREASDQGRPIVAENPEDPAAKAIWAIASEIAAIPRGLSGKKLGINPV